MNTRVLHWLARLPVLAQRSLYTSLLMATAVVAFEALQWAGWPAWLAAALVAGTQAWVHSELIEQLVKYRHAMDAVNQYRRHVYGRR